MVTRWSRSTSHSYLRLVKILQVSMSSCGKFIHHLETRLLIQFLKQGPAYKKEGQDPNKGSNQQ